MNKTEVEVVSTMYTSDFRVGTVGYIDGYVVENGQTYAVVIADGDLKTMELHCLKVT